MSRAWLAVAGLFCLAISAGLFAGIYRADSARLQPDRRVVEVHELDNGYLILYKTANNPYPVREAVAINAAAASLIVTGYLQSPLPTTQWGK